MNFFGETPDHWTKSSVGKYCDVQLGKMLQSNPSSDQDELKPYLRAVNISKSGLNLSHDFSMWIRPQEMQRFRLAKGDILVSEGGDVGRTAIFDVEGEYYFQNAINRVRPNHDSRVVPEFIFHWFGFLKASGYVEMICNVATIPHFTAEKAKAAPLAIPPLDTQRRIARFLDDRTAKIDELIEKKRKLLGRLAEERQSLITRAVTRDPNSNVSTRLDRGGHHEAEREDGRATERVGDVSKFGCSHDLPEWAAQVPEDWVRHWLKWSVDLSTQRPTAKEQEILPYISNENVSSYTGKLLIDEPKPTEADSRKFRENDVLFNKLRPYLAKVYHATFDGVSSSELLCLRPNHTVEPRFLFYVLISKGFIDTVGAETFGAKMPRVDWTIVGHQPLPLPPVGTQRRIVQFLDKKTAEIDATAKKVALSIDYLSEYRSALNTAAVTGQLAELR